MRSDDIRFDDEELEIIVVALRCLRELADADARVTGAALTCVTYCADRAADIRGRIAQHYEDKQREKNDG